MGAGWGRRQIQNYIMFIHFPLMILMYSIKLCVNIQCCLRKQFELLRFTLGQICVYRSIYAMQAINGSFLYRSSYFSTYTRSAEVKISPNCRNI